MSRSSRLSQCVPLESHFNASTSDESLWPIDLIPTLTSLPGGRQRFWGLPFQLGDGEAGRFNILCVGERWGSASKELAVGGVATHVIFAHFCEQGSDADDAKGIFGGSTDVGSSVGRYSLVHTDGSESTVALRRRFEITPPWGSYAQQPFLAVPHKEPAPVDFRGPYPRGGWGQMQQGVVIDKLGPAPVEEDTEDIVRGVTNPPGVWVLFAMENPTPEAAIRAIRVESDEGVTVAVGAVTLFRGATHPFRRERLHTMHLTSGAAADGQTHPEIGIDLGIVARIVIPTPVEASGWSNGPFGIVDGPSESEKNGGICAQVSASPEATLSVGNSTFGMRQIYDQGNGVSEDGRWRARIVDRDRMWLTARVVDGATGEPTPARVHFRSSEGRYLPPYGHRAAVNPGWFEDYGADLKLGSTEYAYVDGRFRIEVPPGPVLVEVSKGFEYKPMRAVLDIEPHQKELTLELDRLADWQNDGWVNGDTHVHFLSPDTARLEAKAEGVNVVNLLAAQWGDLYTNVGDITGELSGCSDEDTLVWVGTENRQHFLGHISLLGVRGQPVVPLSTGGPVPGYLGDGTASALADWADEARRKEGLVIAPHFPLPQSEIIADVILGKVDAVELAFWWTQTLDYFRVHEWYRLLNCGYRVPVVGGSDKMSAGTPIGATRTYAHIGDYPLGFATWAEAVRAGRTYTTSGPLLDFEVEGHKPGGQIELALGGGSVHVKASAVSAVPLRTIEIVLNGHVVADTTTSDTGQLTLAIDEEIQVDASGWIAARCSTGQIAPGDFPTLVAAHTSPVYFTCGDSKPGIQPETGRYFLATMQGSIDWLDTLATVESPAVHERIRQVFLDAMAHVRSAI